MNLKFVFIGTSLIVFSGLFIFQRLIEIKSTDYNISFISEDKRPSATFLLGSDKDGKRYFELAERYFISDSIERTDVVVKSLSSLTSLIEYLEKFRGKVPWGVINVVVHGNAWSGLSVPLWPEGSRAFPKEILTAVSQEKFPVLTAAAIDRHTKINFWACGIGKNSLINLALEKLFTNAEGERSDLYVSPHFVIFQELKPDQLPVRIAASYWPYFYKRGYRPADREIVNYFKAKFPEKQLDWQRSVHNSLDGSVTEGFSDEFHVPVVWTVLYEEKNDRPDVSDDARKIAWLQSQPALMEKIENLQIPFDKYSWTVNKIIYFHPDGTPQPAIKAIGMCTVLCVMAPEGL